LIFQLTTVTELGGQRSQRGLAKLPVSISGIEVIVCYTRPLETGINSHMSQQIDSLLELEHADFHLEQAPAAE
jgi:hypothetical protein